MDLPALRTIPFLYGNELACTAHGQAIMAIVIGWPIDLRRGADSGTGRTPERTRRQPNGHIMPLLQTVRGHKIRHNTARCSTKKQPL